jgi:hypothetical protein
MAVMNDLTRTEKIQSVQRLKKAAALDPSVNDPADIWILPFTVEEVSKAYPPSEDQRTCTPEAVTKVLNNLANLGVMYTACIGTGMSLPSFDRIKKDNKELLELVAIAKTIYAEKVSHAVHCRAINGWLEPVFYQGDEVGYVRKFSDRLLEMQAKRHCPEYRDRSQMDVNVGGGVLVVHKSNMSKEEWLKAYGEAEVKKIVDAEVVE